MGLSKPIIITNSSVDISNLATKSDLANIGGAVKSVQHIRSLMNVQKAGSEQLLWDNSTPYLDVTISSVDKDKCLIVNNANIIHSYTGCMTTLSNNSIRIYGNNSYRSTHVLPYDITIIEFE